MTISAQQLKIPGVSRPILEASSPCVAAAPGANLRLWIYVVNVESAVILKAALNALAAKLSDQFKFALPVAGALVDAVSVLVPVVAQATARTKAVSAFFTAGLALTRLAPAVGQITGLPTILRALMPTRWFTAVFASIHGVIIPKYLACERIENAQRQSKLFDEPKAKPEQMSL